MMILPDENDEQILWPLTDDLAGNIAWRQLSKSSLDPSAFLLVQSLVQKWSSTWCRACPVIYRHNCGTSVIRVSGMQVSDTLPLAHPAKEKSFVRVCEYTHALC
eukprot:1160680-Pelagomonas_calceolata.AAC.4